MNKFEYQLSAYDYELDSGYIAQTPAGIRDGSRLLVVDRNTDQLSHEYFSSVLEYFKSGDVLVRNNTKVFPARIFGRKATGASIEFLLLEKKNGNKWLVLCRPAKRVRVGDVIQFTSKFKARVLEVFEAGKRLVEFDFDGDFWQILDTIGNMPVPPYIDAERSGLTVEYVKDRYQTVFACQVGSAAAPTAGLHFTKEIFSALADMGVAVIDVTLHVGLGTFTSVKTENILDHQMHEEYYSVSFETAVQLQSAKAQGRRIIAVGTTSVRVLETIADTIIDCPGVGISGRTSIFIYPGYEFKLVSGIITNFHLPMSSLLMLISAFYDRKKLLNIYEIAKQENYRFFSFGDAMLLL